MKLLLAFLSFGPYHQTRLRACRYSGYEIVGLSMAKRQEENRWTGVEDASIVYATEARPLEDVSPREWRKLLEPVLDNIAPDVCAVAGYSHPSMLSLIMHCTRRGIPWILMSDSQEIDEPRTLWKEWIKSRVVRLAAAGFAAGRRHVEYLAKLGIPANECEIGYDVVNNTFFTEESAKWRMHDTTALPYFLASARFIPKKNLPGLLSAYASYATSKTTREIADGGPKPGTWPLCILGDGEQKSALIVHCHELCLKVIECAPWEHSEFSEFRPITSGLVFLPGFRQIEELPRFYAGAAAFVHASTSEQWGLVVNEAMASGLPVIVSNRCGCAPDLVFEGENGWTFDPTDREALASLLTKVADLPENERAALGEASRRIIANWGPVRFAAGLAAAANRALRVGPRRAGWFDRLLLDTLARRGQMAGGRCNGVNGFFCGKPG